LSECRHIHRVGEIVARRLKASEESMEKTNQLEDIAANLDDISLDLDEIKDKMSQQGSTSAKALEKLEKIEDGVTRAADAVDEAVESGTDGH
jgi:archaellum component FlaC